jgi:hypothetical protein
VSIPVCRRPLVFCGLRSIYTPIPRKKVDVPRSSSSRPQASSSFYSPGSSTIPFICPIASLRINTRMATHFVVRLCFLFVDLLYLFVLRLQCGSFFVLSPLFTYVPPPFVFPFFPSLVSLCLLTLSCGHGLFSIDTLSPALTYGFPRLPRSLP